MRKPGEKKKETFLSGAAERFCPTKGKAREQHVCSSNHYPDVPHGLNLQPLRCRGASPARWPLTQPGGLKLLSSRVRATKPPGDPLPAGVRWDTAPCQPPAPCPVRRKGSCWPLASTSCIVLNIVFQLHVLFSMKQTYRRK